jgi:DNA polymerase-1
MTTTLAAPVRTTLYLKKGQDPAKHVASLKVSMRTGDVIAFDIETNALAFGDPRARVRSIQVGNSHVAVLLDPADPTHVAAAREVLNDPAYRLTAHNAGFDITFLTQLGVFDSVKDGWARVVDTFILATMLMPPEDDRAAYRSLKAMTAAWNPALALSADAKSDLKQVFDDNRWKGLSSGWNVYKAEGDEPYERDPLRGNGWARIPRDHPVYRDYCAADVFDSAALVGVLEPVVRGLWPQRVEVEHRAARMACEMTYRGMRLDRKWTEEKLSEAQADLVAARKTLIALGVTEPTDTQFGAAFRTLGVKLRYSGTGDVATDKLSLRRYADQGPEAATLVEAIKTYRDAQSRIGFAARFLLYTSERVHGDISTLEAKTGRFSVSRPSLQNIPKKGAVRECLVADPGTVLISADFSSIEMRVAAAVVQEAVLLEMYCTPLPKNATLRQKRERDPYWKVAWAAYGDDATEDQRDSVKSIVLGKMYGGGAETLADGAGLSVPQVREILAKYDVTYPRLKSWAKENLHPLCRNGIPGWHLETGRWQTIDPTRHYAALNMAIQGTARDLLIEAMFRLEDAGLGDFMLLPIHDELIFQVPEAEAADIRDRIIEAMTTTFLDVPIVAEADILGKRWTKNKGAIKAAEERYGTADISVTPVPEPVATIAPESESESEPVATVATVAPEPEPCDPAPTTIDPAPAPVATPVATPPAPGGGIARPAKRYGARIADPTAIVYADGGYRPKDGIGGCGAVVFDATAPESVLAEVSEATREWTTNNVAEYQGLIAGLEKAVELGHRRAHVRLDSKLVVRQVCGDWRVNAEHLGPLHARARELAAHFEAIALEWIPREQNAHADRLANEAMDAVLANQKEITK